MKQFDKNLIEILGHICSEQRDTDDFWYFGIFARLLWHYHEVGDVQAVENIADALSRAKFHASSNAAEESAIIAKLAALVHAKPDANVTTRIAAIRLLSAICPTEKTYIRALVPLFQKARVGEIDPPLELLMAVLEYAQCWCLAEAQRMGFLEWLARALIGYLRVLQNKEGQQAAAGDICLILANKAFDDAPLNLDGYRRRAFKHAMAKAVAAENAEDFALAECSLVAALAIKNTDRALVERHVNLILTRIEYARKQGEEAELERHYQKLFALKHFPEKVLRRMLRVALAEPET